MTRVPVWIYLFERAEMIGQEGPQTVDILGGDSTSLFVLDLANIPPVGEKKAQGRGEAQSGSDMDLPPHDLIWGVKSSGEFISAIYIFTYKMKSKNPFLPFILFSTTRLGKPPSSPRCPPQVDHVVLERGI